MGWQQTIIIGNVGRDPEFKYTPQGVAVCTFSVAVSKVTGRGDERQEKTTWFRVTLWRERAETASQYIKKGMRLMVVGEIDASAYISKQTNQPVASLELTGRDFQMLDGRADAQVGANSSRVGTGELEEPGDLPF